MHSRLVPVVRGPVPRSARRYLKQDGQDGQDLQDRAAQECGEKVWKTFMSIARRRNMQKRSERTLIVIASEAGWPGFPGFSGCRFLGGAAVVVLVVRGSVSRASGAPHHGEGQALALR